MFGPLLGRASEGGARDTFAVPGGCWDAGDAVAELASAPFLRKGFAMGVSIISSRAAGFLVQVLALLWAVAPAQALLVQLDTGVLPSQQGWDYLSMSAPESSVFSVAGNEVVQDSLGIGVDFSAYRHPAAINVIEPLQLQVGAVLSATTQPAGFGPGLYFAAFTGAERYSLVLEPGRVSTLEGTSLGALDTGVFHDYELVAVPGLSFSLFVDGVFFAAGSGSGHSGSTRIEFGDGSFSQNAAGRIESFSFYQGTEEIPLEVPEPSSLLLILLGVAGFGRSIRGRASGRRAVCG